MVSQRPRLTDDTPSTSAVRSSIVAELLLELASTEELGRDVREECRLALPRCSASAPRVRYREARIPTTIAVTT